MVIKRYMLIPVILLILWVFASFSFAYTSLAFFSLEHLEMLKHIIKCVCSSLQSEVFLTSFVELAWWV